MKGDYLSSVRLIQIQICSAFKEKPTSYLFSSFHLFDIKVPMGKCWHLILPFQTCTPTPSVLKLACYTLLGPEYMLWIHSFIHLFIHLCSMSATGLFDISLHQKTINLSHSHRRAIHSSQFIPFKNYFVCVLVCVKKTWIRVNKTAWFSAKWQLHHIISVM